MWNKLILISGRRGFLGLSPTGTDADVYLRIHDRSGHISEPISLRRSTKLSNPFESGKIGNKKQALWKKTFSQFSQNKIHLISVRKHLWKVFPNLNCITMELIIHMVGMSNMSTSLIIQMDVDIVFLWIDGLGILSIWSWKSLN